MISALSLRMHRATGTALSLLFALALSGCATTGAGTASSKTTPEKPAAKSGIEDKAASEAQIQSLIKEDPIAAAAYWGSIYEGNPKDPAAAAGYGDALRQIGSTDKALTVLRQAVGLTPEDPRVLTAYGKALAASGNAGDAKPLLERAIALDGTNAQALSAAGVIEDQLGQHDKAAARYEAALKLKPDDAFILNNYGLSRAFAGDLAKAEALLRQAAAAKGANAQVRQNLALVLGLAGKFDEAERLSDADLMPKDSRANMDYIRSLLGQPARWNDMSGLPRPRTEARANAGGVTSQGSLVP